MRNARARACIDLLMQSRALEVESLADPRCFGPRIGNEPFTEGFLLPRDMPKYDGSVNPEDWLIDYVTTVGIATGNRRVSVCYVPLMLLDSARI